MRPSNAAGKPLGRLLGRLVGLAARGRQARPDMHDVEHAGQAGQHGDAGKPGGEPDRGRRAVAAMGLRQPEHQRNQGRADRLPQEARSALDRAGAAAASRGALATIARLFGDWNSPKPQPHSATRQTMSLVVGCAGSIANSTKPAASTASPMPPRMPAGWRSANRPAIGARIAVITAQGVINRPVSTAEAPSTSWK